MWVSKIVHYGQTQPLNVSLIRDLIHLYQSLDGSASGDVTTTSLGDTDTDHDAVFTGCVI